ncbi:MAG: DUF58 domain-containing protein [Gammaproteobacteria bacterium]|nr:DUF58 domain-containing protein [Gammaproteobacteria bacterium]MDH5591258.1 DUF58 domain-containing protein [Gammaproteobacteria bacterium]
MTRALSRIYQKFTHVRGRRLFIIPTRFGFVYAGFLILILLGAINYSNSMGHVLSFLLGSLGLVAMLHTYRNLAKIEFIQAYADPVFCGQSVNFNLVFANSVSQHCYQIEVASKQNKSPSWNPFKRISGYKVHQVIPKLNSEQNTHIIVALAGKQRGKQPLGHIRIASQFPLGLYNVWSYFNNDYTAIIYPKPSGQLTLPVSSEHGQKFHHHQQKGLDDFSGFNNYRTGDPIHTIAWKAVARDKVLRTKQFTSLQGGQLMLLWQDVAQLKDTEARLSQLCLWVIQAESAGMSYGLTLPNSTINYGHGEQHRHRCLTALALYD